MIRESAHQVTWLDDNGYCKGMQCTKCKAFPCHPDIPVSQFSCKFCFCPFFYKSDCPGKPTYLDNGVKDCSKCSWIHNVNNSESIEHIMKKEMHMWKNEYRSSFEKARVVVSTAIGWLFIVGFMAVGILV